jgi:hypothetical protein
MKPLLRVFLTLGVLSGAAGGCSDLTEPTAPENVPTAPPPGPSDTVNTAPRAYAGRDVWVPFPVDSVVLSGFATDRESNIASYEWKKVSGPASYSVESPNSLQTKVAGLEIGTYEFEFTVTDAGGLTDKDTVSILVYDPLTTTETELILKNELSWNCPRSCNLGPIGYDLLEGRGVLVQVFVKGAGIPGDWVEASPGDDWKALLSGNDDWLVYGFTNGDLWIYSHNAVGDSHVKLVFLTTHSSFLGGG